MPFSADRPAFDRQRASLDTGSENFFRHSFPRQSRWCPKQKRRGRKIVGFAASPFCCRFPAGCANIEETPVAEEAASAEGNRRRGGEKSGGVREDRMGCGRSSATEEAAALRHRAFLPETAAPPVFACGKAAPPAEPGACGGPEGIMPASLSKGSEATACITCNACFIAPAARKREPKGAKSGPML